METVRLDEGLLRTTAPNGLVVLTETLPGVRSAAVGIYVGPPARTSAASRWGSPTCWSTWCSRAPSAAPPSELALELEVRGGGLDAFTGRDYTSYQAHVLDADLPLAVEILTDLVRRPLLRQSDLEPERNVVLEEINGVADTPDDLVFELHAAGALARSSLRLFDPRTPETLGRLSRRDLAALHRTATTAGTA